MGYQTGYQGGYQEAAGAALAIPIFFFSGAGAPAAEGAAVSFGGVASFTVAAAPDIAPAQVAFAGTGDFSAVAHGVLYASFTGAAPGTFAAAATRTVAWASASFVGRGALAALVRPRGDRYRILVVNNTGYAYGELENATLEAVTWELNAPETAEFSIPTLDPKTALLRPGREIQIWRGDQLLFWGPLIRPQADPDRYRAQCAGPLWYFGRRFMGRADRVNQVTNGDFEQGLGGWSPSGGVAATVVNDPTVQGGRAVRLVGSSALHTQYLGQVYTHRQSHPEGDLMTLAAWVYVPSADYLGVSYDARGLYMERRLGSTIKKMTWDPIDAATPKDEWVRLEAYLPNVLDGEVLDVRLYPPHGVAIFDLVTLTYMESLHLGNMDQAKIMEAIVQYAQDRYVFRHGKSDLRVGTNCPSTGRPVMTKTWQFADHANILDTLQEFTAARYGVDMSVELTPTTRTFTTWYPSKGALRPDLALELGRNITEFTWSWDGEEASTSVVVLGPGDGPDREEGAATDWVGFDGVSLEQVQVAPDGSDVGQLDHLAEEALRISRSPEIVEVLTHEGAGGLIGLLRTGDKVPTRIAYGPIDVDHVYRVVQMSLDPIKDSLRITLNFDDTETEEEAMARVPMAVAATRRPGGGFWVVAADGGVFAFGGAPFYGSMGGVGLSGPAVDLVARSTGAGYWVVAADGGIFAFGDAPVIAPYLPMVETEYEAGDRAIVGAEALDDDTLYLMADDGAGYELSA